MSIFGGSQGHFKAVIEIYSCGLDTRKRPAFNGIRWSFVYAEDIEQLGLRDAPHSDVWPDFLDGTGASMASGIPLVGDYNAIMHIVFDHMVETHYERLNVGTKFFCMEGTRKVAEGIVTNLSAA